MTNIHRITTTAVLFLSLAAAAAPGASARPAVYSPQDKSLVQSQSAASQPAGAYSRQDKSLVATNSQSTAGATIAKVSSTQPVVRVVAPNNEFDWGDAGIGAAGGLGLSMIGLGGALAVSQRRARRTRTTTAVIS
ncbi:MAG TPA: hypothetical protein VH279_02750 [Solirubrobacteraceae bacterium]|jgi:hypothetical protein|nr:hypothetical protein [Solirubrobacteraceae bacterium]